MNKKEIFLQRRHRFHVSDLPQNFVCLAESSITPNEIIRHKEKVMYGFQTHPEVSGDDGLKMIENFLRIAGLIK